MQERTPMTTELVVAHRSGVRRCCRSHAGQPPPHHQRRPASLQQRPPPPLLRLSGRALRAQHRRRPQMLAMGATAALPTRTRTP
jgi:hypothetical protein